MQKKLLARDTCIQYIFTFLYPDSQPASADPPPSPHTHSSGASDVDINGTSGLTPTAGNTPNCVCVQAYYFLLSLTVNMRLISCSCILSSCLSQKETVRRCRWVKSPSLHLRCSAMAQRELLSSGTVYVFWHSTVSKVNGTGLHQTIILVDLNVLYNEVLHGCKFLWRIFKHITFISYHTGRWFHCLLPFFFGYLLYLKSCWWLTAACQILDVGALVNSNTPSDTLCFCLKLPDSDMLHNLCIMYSLECI